MPKSNKKKVFARFSLCLVYEFQFLQINIWRNSKAHLRTLRAFSVLSCDFCSCSGDLCSVCRCRFACCTLRPVWLAHRQRVPLQLCGLCAALCASCGVCCDQLPSCAQISVYEFLFAFFCSKRAVFGMFQVKTRKHGAPCAGSSCRAAKILGRSCGLFLFFGLDPRAAAAAHSPPFVFGVPYLIQRCRGLIFLSRVRISPCMCLCVL